MTPDIPLLIIGAGPFGLALAAYSVAQGLECAVLGEPMAFWRHNMPRGMLLRSTCDWHLDPCGTDTIDRYLAVLGASCTQVEPLSRDFYLAYTDWFVTQKGIQTVPRLVRRLDRDDSGFVVTLDSGERVSSRKVAVAVGLGYFPNTPAEVASVLPPGSFAHTSALVEFEQLRDRRCLIVGGRQSAFEWAALLREAGASAVHLCYRHETPAFEQSDWSWVASLVDRTRTHHGWYRNLAEHEKRAINRRMWDEGRARLEPWLKPRISHESVHLWPHTQVSACMRSGAGEIRVQLDNSRTIVVDEIILATGYRVDMSNVPFLRNGNLWAGLKMRDGYPELDEFFQSSQEGLFITGPPAVQDFGPFFGFTAAVAASAERIVQQCCNRW